MRIGADAQVLTWTYRSGLFNYLRSLLLAIDALQRDRVTAFLKHNDDWREATTNARTAVGSRLAIRRYDVPWPPYRLRSRLSSLNRQDVFLHLTESAVPLGPHCARVFVVPDLITRHWPDMVPAAHQARWEAYYAAAAALADRVITYSEHVRADVVSTLGIAADRITAIPLAPDERFQHRETPASLDEQLAVWGLQRGKFILNVGNLEPRKNHGVLLQAVAELVRRRALPQGVKLVFAGAKGHLYDAAEVQTRALALDEHVRFLGHADPLDVLYHGAALLAFPSRAEGFGLPPLEAMACGTPVITSNASSLPEVVGDAGVLLDPDDVGGWADAIERMLTDAPFRESLRVKGAERAAHFSWARTAAAYRDVMSSAVERRR